MNNEKFIALCHAISDADDAIEHYAKDAGMSKADYNDRCEAFVKWWEAVSLRSKRARMTVAKYHSAAHDVSSYQRKQATGTEKYPARSNYGATSSMARPL